MITVLNCEYCGSDHVLGDPCEKFAAKLNAEGYGPKMVAMVDGLRPEGWSGYRPFLSFLNAAVELEVRGMRLPEIRTFLSNLNT